MKGKEKRRKETEERKGKEGKNEERKWKKGMER